MRTRGVLVIKPDNPRLLLVPEQRRHLDTFAALTAIALERVHYVEVAQQALIHMESERLRNSLLSALSHDLRTPLAALVGLAESLAMTRPALSREQIGNRASDRRGGAADGAHWSAICSRWRASKAARSSCAGSGIRSRRSWAARSRPRSRRSSSHRVDVNLARDLPLVEFDATLIERVLYNLIENACKYTPPGTVVSVTAEASGRQSGGERQRHGSRHTERPGRVHLRKIHARDARIVHAGRRAGACDQPRHHRSAPRKDRGGESTRTAARDSRSRCRWERRR